MTAQADTVRDRRRASANPGGFHDKLIRFLATALPAAVGVVAAVMVLSPLSPRGEISFLLDRTKVAVAQDRVRVADASYRGVDNQGRQFTVSAGEAVQRSAEEPAVHMGNLAASIQMANGPATLTAPDGTYDFDRDTVKVAGPVQFSTADGYSLSASGVTIDLKSRQIAGSGGISGTVPAGTFSASGIAANLDERVVALTGGAHLHMTQGRMKMP